MKFVIVLIALAGVCAAAPATRDLGDDLRDILAVIPREKMREVAHKYLQNDAEFQRVVRYLQGSEWAGLVAAVAKNEAYQRFRTYLVDAGVDMDLVIGYIHNLIANAEVPNGGSGSGGVREFLNEIKALVPVENLLIVVADKMDNSPEFQAFYAKISSPEGKALFEEVRAMAEVQRLAGVLREFGIDVDLVVSVIYLLLGWA